MKKILLFVFLITFQSLFAQINNQLNFENTISPSYLYRVVNTTPSMISTGDFTLEMWIFVPQNTPNQSDFVDINSFDNNNNVTSSLSLGKNGSELHISFSYNNSSHIANSSAILVKGWNHIALIKTGNNIKLATNGTIEQMLTISGFNPDFSKCLFVLNASNTATTLDTSSSKFTNISNVIYDEIRLWNKALSIEQIVSNMYNQVFSNPDLSAYWSCDVNSISNGVVPDLGSNNFYLTINGNPKLEKSTSPVYDGGNNNNVLFDYTQFVNVDVLSFTGRLDNGGSAFISTIGNTGVTGSTGLQKVYDKSWIIENRLLDSLDLIITLIDTITPKLDLNKLVLLESDEQLFLNPVIHTFTKDQNGKYKCQTIFGDSDKAKFYTIAQSSNFNPKLQASKGFGPFYQDEPLNNTIMLTNMPIGINNVIFYFIDRFGSIIDSVKGNFNSSKTQATISYDMGTVPPNTLLLVKMFYDNGPTQGINFIKELQIIPIVPRVTIQREIEGFDDNATNFANRLLEFNSYKLGDTNTTLIITVDSLPRQTTKVIITLTDANDNNLCYLDTLNMIHCDSYTKLPDAGKLYVDKATWTIKLDTTMIQLSSKIGVRVYHKKGYPNGSLFTYPLKIYPPDIIVLSSNGWEGTTNNYQFNTNISTPWQPLKDVFNLQFSTSSLPPQTRKVIYSIIDVDSNVVWADTVTNYNNQPLTSALSNTLNMRNLDLDATTLNAKIFALGGPKQGLNIYHKILAKPQYPRISPTALGQYIVRDPADSNDKRNHYLEIRIEPSTLNTDSIRISWIDNSDKIYYSNVLIPQYDTFCECNLVKFEYDVLSLPYVVTGLNIKTFYKGSPKNGLDTTVAITLLPPPPKSSALYTGNNFINNFNFYQRWSLSNFPEKTLRTIINVTDSTKSKIVRTDTIYPNRSPYDYNAKFNNSSVKSPLLTNINEFTAMLWFNTSSEKGGMIMTINDTSMTPNINLFMADSGYVCFSMYDKTYSKYDIGNTLYRYNSGVWHHLAVVLRKSDNKYFFKDRLEIYIDGGLVETYDDTLKAFQNIINGYITLGYGSLPSSDPNYPTNLYFDGSMSDFRFISKALSYEEIMTTMLSNKPYPVNNNQPLAIWWKFDDINNTMVNDYNGNNKGTITGQLSWFHSLYQTNIFYFLNTKNLPQGWNYVYVIPQYFGGSDTPYAYKIDSLKIDSTLIYPDIIPPDTRKVDIKITNGLGYFEQGDICNINIQAEIEILNSYAMDKFGLALTIVNPDNSLNTTHYFSAKRSTIDTNKFWVSGTLDVGGAFPGSHLLIKTLDTVYTIPEVYSMILLPIYTKKVPLPEVKYNSGPFLQAVAPGTMHQYSPIILKNVGDDISKITVTFYDYQNNVLDTARFTKVQNEYRTWQLNYDMGKLWPPYSTFVFNMWANEENEALDTSNAYSIEIIRTRPLWMNNPNYVIYKNISETSDSVFFTLKLMIVPKNYELNNSFSIPASFVLIGGGKLYQTGSMLEMPMGYSKETRKLHKTGDAIKTALVSNFRSGFLIGFLEKMEWEKDKQTFKFAEQFEKTLNAEKSNSPTKSSGSWTFEPTFSSKQTNKIDIDDDNLLTIQSKSNYEVGAHFDIPAIDAMIQELNASITAELAPWSAIIRPVFGFAMELELFMAERDNKKSDSLGNIIAVGELDLKAEKEGNEYIDSPENASYNGYGALFGLDFSLGAEIAMGALGKVTIHFITEFPLSFVKMYNNEDKRFLYDLDFALYWQVDASIFFGLITFNVVPKSLFYHGRIFGDKGDFNLIYAKSKEKKQFDDFIQSKQGKLVKVDNLKNKREVYPQPDIETINGKTGMLWLEQSVETGYSTIVFSENSKESSTFSTKKYIYSTNHNINTPKFDYLSDNKIIITWVQSRFNQYNIPSNLSGFNLLNEIIKGQDIWYAVYDLEKDSVLTISKIDDDEQNLTSGRVEGNPLVKRINNNKAIIVWTVSDLDQQESDLYYSIISYNNQIWNESEAEAICGNIPGTEINQSIGLTKDGDIVLSWINVSKDNKNRKIMGSVFSNSNWSPCNTLADEINGKIRYLDMEFESEYSALIWTEGRHDNDENDNLIPKEKINFIMWNNNTKNWDKSTYVTVLDTNILEAKEPNIEISESGKIAILYQNNEMRGPIRKINALFGDINNIKNWKHSVANQFICDTNKRLYDFDFGFKGDTLFIIKQENLIENPSLINNNIKNGINIGINNANLVLRTVLVDGGPTNLNEEKLAENLRETDNILIYPNPVKDFLNIQFKDNNQVLSFDIYDAKGSILRFENYTNKGNDYSIDVSNLPQGIYYIKYNDGNGIKSKSFVVVK